MRCAAYAASVSNPHAFLGPWLAPKIPGFLAQLAIKAAADLRESEEDDKVTVSLEERRQVWQLVRPCVVVCTDICLGGKLGSMRRRDSPIRC